MSLPVIVASETKTNEPHLLPHLLLKLAWYAPMFIFYISTGTSTSGTITVTVPSSFIVN
jgi:hypothetical protein